MYRNREGQCGEDGIRIRKELINCVQNNVRTFGIAEDWKSTAFERDVWVETVTGGRRISIAAWEKAGKNAARHRQEKREGTSCYRTPKYRNSEATPIGRRNRVRARD